MKFEVARALEERIVSALLIADQQGLADIAIKLNEALVLVNGIGKEPPIHRCRSSGAEEQID